MPGFKRTQNVLSRRIGTIEKPDVQDAKGRESFAGFYLAHRAESVRLFIAGFVAATVSTRPENHRDALMFVENGFGEISAHHRFVIGMSDDQQNVRLEALVGRKVGRSFGDFSGSNHGDDTDQNENRS